MPRVKLEGLRGCKAALRALPKATGRGVQRKVLREEAKPMIATARQRVRVDQGDLRDSLGVSTKLTRRQRRGARAAKKPGDVVMYAGAGGLTQAITEEFGTENQAPHPFLRPAWDEHRPRMLKSIPTRYWREIEAAARRLERKALRLKKAKR